MSQIKMTFLYRCVDRHWTIFFPIALVALFSALALLFLKGGVLGAILGTIILLKILDV